MQLFALLLLSQAAPPPPPPQDVKPEDRVSIEGQVVNAITGAPLRKAEVRLSAENRPAAMSIQTDQAGRFLAGELAPGQYILRASANGYVRGTTERLDLSPKTKKTGLILKVTPQAVIAGRVLDEDGDPVPQAQVSAVLARVKRRATSEESTPVASQTHTNDLGEYRLSGLAAGSYLISATPPANRWSDGPPPSAATNRRRLPMPTLFPSALDAATAQAVKVIAGQDARGTDIRLRSGRSVRVTGRVQAEGQKLEHVSVQLRRPGAGFMANMSARVQADGVFEFADVTPGDYIASVDIYVESKERATPFLARQNVTVGADDVSGILLMPRAGARLRGTVTVETPPADLTDLRVELIAKEDEAHYYNRSSSAKVTPRGEFETDPMALGTYQVIITTDRPYYIKSATYNGRDILSTGLDNSTSGELAVTLASGGGVITSSITWPEKDKPTSVAVVAWAAGAPDQRYRRRTCDVAKEKSACDLTGLAPGEYKIAAFAGEWSDLGHAQDPAFLREMEEKAESLSVTANSKQSKALQLIRLDVD